eukprot:15462210-Alexandrium_andersonii.AAC.2
MQFLHIRHGPTGHRRPHSRARTSPSHHPQSGPRGASRTHQSTDRRAPAPKLAPHTVYFARATFA